MKTLSGLGLCALALIMGVAICPDASAQPRGATPTTTVSLFDTKTAPRSLGGQPATVKRATVQRQTTIGGVPLASRLGSQQRLRVAPFAGVSFELTRSGLSSTSQGATVWRGTVAGSPKSSALLLGKGRTLVGNIQRGTSVYTIRTQPDGSLLVREIEVNKLPAEATAIPVRRFPVTRRLDICHALPNPNTQIDVFVAYTQAAETAAGGADAMGQEIELSIADTNAAFQASGVNTRVNLVGTKKYNYTESDLETNKARIIAKNDGHLDDVHTQRDNTGADVVMLLTATATVGTKDYCGVAGMIMDDPSAEAEDSAFTVVKQSCSSSNHSFAHELGHLVGLHHDTAVDSSGVAYAHGHVNVADRWRTIMAYNAACGNNWCDRLQYFSNPSVSYANDPTGQQGESENARRLRENSPTVSLFRVSTSDGNAGWQTLCARPVAGRRPLNLPKDCPKCVKARLPGQTQIQSIWK